jgi:glucokinase
MAAPQVLLGDIGGTNVRLAVYGGGRLGPLDWFAVADYPQFDVAVTEFLRRHGHPAIRAAILAVAGPVENNRAELTNFSWIIDGPQLSQTFGLSEVRVINDFEATAWSLARLGPENLVPIGGGQGAVGAPMAVLGPGTGLGVASFVPSAGGGTVIATEGGHATLPGTSHQEDTIIEELRRQFGHVSAERAVSGSGLENLYRVIAGLEGIDVPERNAAGIAQSGMDGSCPTSRAALQTFCAFLGAIAGNVALTFGARGGVFIAGGIAPRILEFLARSEFRDRFEAKGRLRKYLEAISTRVIIHPDVTMVGLQALVERTAALK